MTPARRSRLSGLKQSLLYFPRFIPVCDAYHASVFPAREQLRQFRRSRVRDARDSHVRLPRLLPPRLHPRPRSIS